MSDEFGTSEQKVRAVVCNYRLFNVDEDQQFFSPRLLLYLQPYFEKSERARRAANIRWDNANAYANALPEQSASNASKVKKSKVKNKDNVGQSVPRQHIPYSEIVSFLNKEAGTSFKATTQSTRNHIKARFNEGFSLDNFKAVISTMVDKWQHDEKMVQYIRPQTLFGTKFESYLQSSVEAQPKRRWNV